MNFRLLKKWIEWIIIKNEKEKNDSIEKFILQKNLLKTFEKISSIKNIEKEMIIIIKNKKFN